MTKVLIIDDMEDLRYMYRLCLQLDGYEIVGEAGDGSVGIYMAALTNPDLILLDNAMPQLDGIKAIPRLRTAAPNATIVMLSAFTASSTAAEAIAAGAHSYIEKGGTPKQLVAALRLIAAPEKPIELNPKDTHEPRTRRADCR